MTGHVVAWSCVKKEHAAKEREHVGVLRVNTLTSLLRGKYYDRHQGRKSYMRNLRAHHDYEAEQLWLRSLVREGRASDPEGCLS